MLEYTDNAYVVVVDDDESIAIAIEGILGKPVKWLKNADEAKAYDGHPKPYAAFVDIDLDSEASGIDILPDIRNAVGQCPILVVTGTAKEDHIANALSSGADDFMTKPLSPSELIARVNIRLQDWAQKITKDVILFGDIELNIPNRHLVGPSSDVYVSPIAASIIAHLAQAGSNFVSKENLKKYCWGDFKVTDNALHRKLHSVRQYLKNVSDGVQVQTKYGVGLRLENVKASKPKRQLETESARRMA
ncbi:response regulator transcription factor [Oligoflexaceae bacterium]|nr:response regulator transcription factor [Oligoflexaceae bacterium]